MYSARLFALAKLQLVRGFTTMHYINRLFTYLLTYLFFIDFYSLFCLTTLIWRFSWSIGLCVLEFYWPMPSLFSRYRSIIFYDLSWKSFSCVCLMYEYIWPYLRLRSSSRHHLVVPRHSCSTLGCWAFSVAGPMAWNALPDDLRDPSLSADNFRKMLKTHLFWNALGHLAH